MNDIGGMIINLTVWILPVIFAVTMHEAAHGFVAKLFGDQTASRQGRVTLNPMKHIDPFGTILLPALCLVMPGGGFLFGYAKPVPVNFRALKYPRPATVAVAIAGPGINLLLAFVSLLAMHLVPSTTNSATALACGVKAPGSVRAKCAAPASGRGVSGASSVTRITAARPAIAL